MSSGSKRRLVWLVAAVALLVLLSEPFGSWVGAQQPITQAVIARVRVSNAAETARLIAFGLDLLELREGDDLFIVTTPAQVQQLSAQGWTLRVDEAQTATLRQRRLDTFMGGYRTVPEMRAFADDAAARYPNLAQVVEYGTSWEGRKLFALKLTNQLTNSANKPTLFLMAAIHARELSTSELALRFADYLLSHYGSDGDATWLLDEQQVVVVPVANPDGRVIAEQGYYQRKNTNTSYGTSGCAAPPLDPSAGQLGVDLNRNSAFKWGTVNTPSQNPCDQTYPGPSVASEPETTALQNFIRSYFPDQRGPSDADAAPITTTGVLLTLHSYGNYVLWSWGWTSGSAPNSAGLDRIGRKLAAYNGYTAGQSNTTLYATSGTTDDWAYGELGVAAFTFEVGGAYGACDGFMPSFACLDGDPSGMFWQRNLPAFLYAARVARQPYALAQGPTTESITPTLVTTGTLTLRASLSDMYNGEQSIAAAEYYVDTPPWRGGTPSALAPLDGAFDSASEVATATLALTGRHLVFVRAQDADGNWGPVRAGWVFAAPQTLWLPSVFR